MMLHLHNDMSKQDCIGGFKMNNQSRVKANILEIERMIDRAKKSLAKENYELTADQLSYVRDWVGTTINQCTQLKQEKK